MEGTGFKWGDGPEVPEYLRGKNADETLDIVNTLVQGVRELSMQQSEPQQPQQHYYAEPTEDVNMNEGFPDPNLAITSPQEYQEQLVAAIRKQQQQDLYQAAQPVFTQTAESARTLSSMDPKWGSVWEKYGKEIDNEVQGVPVQQRTKQLYDRAAELIYARHSDDIIEERAKARAQEMLEQGLGTASPSASGYDAPAGQDDHWAKFEQTPLGRKLLDRLGKRKILDYCKADNISLEQYADLVSESRVEFDPDRPGTWTTPDLSPFEGGSNV
jgi:hypothetical protein